MDDTDNFLLDDFIDGIKSLPVVFLFRTIKGKGVLEMENDPVKWHYKELKNIDEITII